MECRRVTWIVSPEVTLPVDWLCGKEFKNDQEGRAGRVVPLGFFDCVGVSFLGEPLLEPTPRKRYQLQKKNQPCVSNRPKECAL